MNESECTCPRPEKEKQSASWWIGMDPDGVCSLCEDDSGCMRCSDEDEMQAELLNVCTASGSSAPAQLQYMRVLRFNRTCRERGLWSLNGTIHWSGTSARLDARGESVNLGGTRASP